MKSTDIIHIMRKTFTLLYGKFIQDNTHKILLESAGFRGRYDKNISVCYFRFTVHIITTHCILFAEHQTTVMN